MPTVIDSLVIELGLDPKKLTDGQKAAVDSFKKTTDEAVKSSKNLEIAAGKVSDQFSNATRAALGFFAAFIGARSLTEFVANIISADAALGRFSTNLGIAPQVVSAWGQVAERFGGSMQGFEGTLSRVQKMLYDNNNGIARLPDAFGRLATRARMNIDYSGDSIKTLTQELLALQKIHNDPKLGGPTVSHGLAQELGIDSGLESAAYALGPGITKYVADIQKTLTPTDDAIKKAQELQEAYTELFQAANKLFGDSVREFEPELLKMIKALNDELPQIRDELSGLATEADNIATAFGGWKNVIEGIVAAFAALKVLQVASMLANISKALSDGGMLALLGKVFAVAGAAYELTDTAPAPDQAKVNAAEKNAWYNRGSSPDYGSLARDPGAHGEALEGAMVDGRPINKGNPLPVMITDKPNDAPGFWDKLGQAAGNLFGFGGGPPPGGGPTQDTAPGAPLRAVGASAGERGWWTKDRQQHVYDRLRKEAGLSDMGAKAAISRWMNVEASGGPTSANNIGGGHYGLGQWSRSRGRSIWGNPDPDAQISLAIKEFNGSEKAAGDALRNAKTAEEGATGMSRYERAEHYNSITGRDDFTGKTLAGMNGINKYVNSVISPTSGNSTSTTSTVHLHGPIAVNTQATDAPGIASALGQSLQQKVAAQMVNTGMN